MHSLGTYHLGTIVSEAVYENSNKHLPDLNWNVCRRSFELACLLHDIGHAPFSHTFEMYYEKGNNLNKLLIDETLIKKVGHIPERAEFFSDYINTTPNQKQHEKVSAILVLTTYYEVLTDLSVDPFLVARMILGLCYIDCKGNNHKKLYNCFIGLLNGKTIDVDKLDYIARDQWATGHISKSISIERLLSSVYIRIDGENYITCFHKRAVNELFTLIEARKSMNVRFYGHHTVKYDEFVLKKAVEESSVLYLDVKNNSPDGALRKIISVDALLGTIKFGTVDICLPTDDDLIHILKSQIAKSKYAKEWFHRDYRLKPLWKTYADYLYYFDKLSIKHREQLYENKDPFVQEYLKSIGHDPNDYYIEVNIEYQYLPIFSADIKIYIKEGIEDFNKLTASNDDPAQEKIKKEYKIFFLLYVKKEIVADNKHRQEFINFLISKSSQDEVSIKPESLAETQP